MKNTNFRDSIIQVLNKDKKFLGTGFLFEVKNNIYKFITCWHVVEKYVTQDSQNTDIFIGDCNCLLLSKNSSDVLDLAVLSYELNESETKIKELPIASQDIIEDLQNKVDEIDGTPTSTTKRLTFNSYGHYGVSEFVSESVNLNGIFLSSSVQTDTKNDVEVNIFRLKVDRCDDPTKTITDGYSGSPVFYKEKVVAVIYSTYYGKDNDDYEGLIGNAIHISNLTDIIDFKPENISDQATVDIQNDLGETKKEDVQNDSEENDKEIVDIKKSYVYRARFQPFCKDHYEAIQGFWLRYVKPNLLNTLKAKGNKVEQFINKELKATDIYEIDDVPDLYLWVVKTLSTTAYNMGKIDTVGGEFFRHISFFNPFSFMECQKIIKRDLVFFIDKEMEILNPIDPKYLDLCLFKEWTLSHLHIVSIPFTIEQMGDYWDNDIAEDDKGWIFGKKTTVDKASSEFFKIFKTLYRETGGSLLKKKKGISLNEMALNLATRFKDTSCLTDPPMYLPIFDRQDEKDLRKLSLVNWTKEVCCRPWVKTTKPSQKQNLDNFYFKTNLNAENNQSICAQNAFIYLVFLLLIERNKTDKSLINDVLAEKMRLNEFLIKRSTINTIQLFEKAATDLINSVNPANIKDNGKLRGVEGDIIESLSNLGLPEHADRYTPIDTIMENPISD